VEQALVFEQTLRLRQQEATTLGVDARALRGERRKRAGELRHVGEPPVRVLVETAGDQRFELGRGLGQLAAQRYRLLFEDRRAELNQGGSVERHFPRQKLE
jgi:hypothetical protein